MKKKVLCAFLATVLCLGLAACGSDSGTASTGDSAATTGDTASDSGSTASADAEALKFAGQHVDDYPSSVAAYNVFIPGIEEGSNGAFTVDYYPSSQLGGELDVMDQLQMGTIQLGYISPVTAALDPTINVIDLPFLFEDEEHVDRVVEGEIGDRVLEALPAAGLRPLGWLENGFRVLSTSGTKIESLADLQGMKIRVPEAPVSIAIFNALGANATPIAFNELYSALQQKVVDGQENGYPTFDINKYYEVQDYIAETKHMWGSNVMYASEQFFSGLSDEHKELFLTVGKEYAAEQRKLYRDMVEVSKQNAIDNGVEITYPDMAEWQAATQVVYDDMYAQYPEFEEIVAEIQALKDNG